MDICINWNFDEFQFSFSLYFHLENWSLYCSPFEYVNTETSMYDVVRGEISTKQQSKCCVRTKYQRSGISKYEWKQPRYTWQKWETLKRVLVMAWQSRVRKWNGWIRNNSNETRQSVFASREIKKLLKISFLLFFYLKFFSFL